MKFPANSMSLRIIKLLHIQTAVIEPKAMTYRVTVFRFRKSARKAFLFCKFLRTKMGNGSATERTCGAARNFASMGQRRTRERHQGKQTTRNFHHGYCRSIAGTTAITVSGCCLPGSSLQAPLSMHHEHGQIGVPADVRRDAPEDCFAEMAVPITAHDEKVGANGKCGFEQSLTDGFRALLKVLQ